MLLCSSKLKKHDNIFVLTFLLIFIALNILCIIFIKSITILSVVYFVIFEIINIGVSFNLTEMILSVIISKDDLQKLIEIEEFPPVAMLYVTFNDAMPDMLKKLKKQTYKNYNVFILDDSSADCTRRIIDQFDYNILRRSNRKGFKAGALNNWISSYGSQYKYFVVSDSDSLFDSDFIEEMVKYAEHSENTNIAIFQSKIETWNKDKILPWAFSLNAPISHYILDRIANKCDLLVSWGHNNLHRTQAIIDCGGFEERFLSEDFATGLNLMKEGFKCRLVDVVSYEALPENIESFAKRQARWAKQNLELIAFDMKGVSFLNQIFLFMSIYQYIVWIVYLIGIILVVFSYDSSWNNVFQFLNYFENNIFIDGTFQKMFTLWLFYIFVFIFLRVPFSVAHGVSLKNYFKSFIITISVGYYVMAIIIKEQLKVVLGEVPSFDVTSKNTAVYSFRKGINQFMVTYLFIIIILIGVVRNPLSLFLNFIFLVPLLISPIVIWLISRNTSSDQSSQLVFDTHC